MASMEYSTAHNAFIKTCVRCDKVYSAVADTYEKAIAIMIQFFGPAAPEADSMKHACKVCLAAERHGRTYADVEAMILEQEGKCFLCDNPVRVRDTYSGLDHDHNTGRNRRFLCKTCNARMSGVDDDEWLERAIKYRDNYRDSQ